MCSAASSSDMGGQRLRDKGLNRLPDLGIESATTGGSRVSCLQRASGHCFGHAICVVARYLYQYLADESGKLRHHVVDFGCHQIALIAQHVLPAVRRQLGCDMWEELLVDSEADKKEADNDEDNDDDDFADEDKGHPWGRVAQV